MTKSIEKRPKILGTNHPGHKKTKLKVTGNFAGINYVNLDIYELRVGSVLQRTFSS